MRFVTIALGLSFSWIVATMSTANAQIVSVPPFAVTSRAFDLDVAATYGGLYFLYAPTPYDEELLLQRVFGPTWDAPYVVNTSGLVFEPVLASVESGGFVAGWLQDVESFARLLDPLGAPAGFPFQVTRSELPGLGYVQVAGLAAGTAIVWSETSDPVSQEVLKARIADRSYVLDLSPFEWVVAPTPNGGCVIAWRFVESGIVSTRAQVFDADGFAVTPPVTLATSNFKLSSVAASPNGDLAVVGTLRDQNSELQEIRAFRFDATGAALGPEVVLGAARVGPGAPGTMSIAPDAAFDFAGNLYVAWSHHVTSTKGVYARALDGNGVPLGPAVQLSNRPSLVSVKVARLPDGRFVNAWVDYGTLLANVVTLCTPGSAVCGDGVREPACERCDDGPANDDTAADACRTNCLPAHCGDGTLDAGEACDDGNFVACDGCNLLCEVEAGVVCGDGIQAPLCGEQCDDGNASALDGCTSACLLERLPGGGSTATDCLTEWSIANPTNEPPFDKHGRITTHQRCVDNDPRCDFDGGTPGSCTFHVRVCANNTDLAGCTPSTRLSGWLVTKPSEAHAASRPALAAVRATLLGTVPGSIVGAIERDVCSGELPLVVPLRGMSSGYKTGKLTIQTRATSYDGDLDKDKLQLTCSP